jgi:4-alpha-glucanotransferase
MRGTAAAGDQRCGTLVRVNSGELRQRAAALGVAVSYWDWQGHERHVPDETLTAIVASIDDAPSPPPPSATAAVCRVPEERSWGFTLQLYSLRSRGSWAHGDLRDLADFAAWAARDHGADFVVINPLHAAEPLPPVSDSPYLPMSRRWISPLYLRIEDIPEFNDPFFTERPAITAVGAALRAASQSPELIDRDAVWTAKRAALEMLRQVPLSPARQALFDEFVVRQGRSLLDWGTWCALAEVHGPDYRTWPRWLRHPRSAEVAAFRGSAAGRIAFHVWVQWLAAEQVALAQETARAAGMSIGIIHDLAVGAHPGGADAWAYQDSLAAGYSVGAPPDEFNQRGQDWTLPPWHPRRLGTAGYRPLAELISALAGSGGGLRIDHVMGLSRLWWIASGASPADGAYVYLDIDGTLGTLASLAAESGAVVIGEDLGTVEPWLRERLGGRGVLGTSMLWFERGPDGAPLPPGQWRRECLATVSTHDMPPAAAFLTGAQVAERAARGLLTRPEDEERAAAAREVDGWLSALAGQGLLPASAAASATAGGERPSADEFTAALYGYLARTPALMIGVSLAEAAGERRSQNMPGTIDEYPNWRVPLCRGDGSPVLVEDLPFHAGIRAVVAAVSQTALFHAAFAHLAHVGGDERGRILYHCTGSSNEGRRTCQRSRCANVRRGRPWNVITPRSPENTCASCSRRTRGAASD